MRKLALLFLGVVACLFISCSDSSSPNDDKNNNNNGNGGNGGGKNFEITSIDRDSVYWGETVNVAFKNAPKSTALTDTFILFVHTFPVTIDSVWCDSSGTGGARFRVPINSTSGQVRLFSGFTQAQKAPSLVIYTKVLSNMRPTIERCNPNKAYPGDLVVIEGTDIPLRPGEVSVTTGNIPFTIVKQDTFTILARVPEGAQSGVLEVRMFDSIHSLGSFDVLQHKGSLLQEQTLSRVSLQTVQLMGDFTITIFTPQDTNSATNVSTMNYSDSWVFPMVAQLPFKDSIVFVGKIEDVQTESTFEVRLKPEAESRASGIIRYIRRNDIGVFTTMISLKNIRWMFADGRYQLYARSIDLPEQLIELSLTDDIMQSSTDKTIQKLSYSRNGPAAYVVMEMWP